MSRRNKEEGVLFSFSRGGQLKMEREGWGERVIRCGGKMKSEEGGNESERRNIIMCHRTWS